MKEYMKMSDFISGLVSNHDGELLDDRGFVAACDGSTSGKGDCIAHAINSHDELVAEVERLRGEIEHLNDVILEITEQPGPY